jgi:hypothetical protein
MTVHTTAAAERATAAAELGLGALGAMAEVLADLTPAAAGWAGAPKQKKWKWEEASREVREENEFSFSEWVKKVRDKNGCVNEEIGNQGYSSKGSDAQSESISTGNEQKRKSKRVATY